MAVEGAGKTRMKNPKFAAAVKGILDWDGYFTPEATATSLYESWRMRVGGEADLSQLKEGGHFDQAQQEKVLGALEKTIDEMESKYGKWEFFRFYLIAGILCGLLWSAVRVGTGTGGALLGASGATTAVAMLFVFSFPRSTLHLYGVVPVKAWVLGVIIIGTNVLGTQSGVTESGAPQVAFDVHLMGAAFAAIYFYGQLNFSFFEGLSGGAKLKFKQRRSGLKVHRPSDDDATDSLLAKDEAESDRILEKILREGKDSLTKKEAAFMQQYSRKVRERRAQQ